MTQYATIGTPYAVELNDHKPVDVQLEGGNLLRFAKVRVVGDTLYGWDSLAGAGPADSVAIPVRHVRTVQQEHFDPSATVVTTVLAVSSAVAAFLALVAFVHLTHFDYST